MEGEAWEAHLQTHLLGLLGGHGAVGAQAPHWCAVGVVCACCGRGLCLLWEEPVPAGEWSVPAVGGTCACCGRGLCLLWEGALLIVGGTSAFFLIW